MSTAPDHTPSATAAPTSTLIPSPGNKEIFSWAFFDFANSSFTTIVATVIFPVYFTKALCAGRTDGDWLWSLALSLSNLVVVLFSPLLGSVADQLGAKKKFLFISTVLCVVGTFFLGFIPSGHPDLVWTALALFIVANIGFSFGENFTAGFLPELSTPQTAGRISSLGWSVGYFGGLFSLGICLLMLQYFKRPVNETLIATALFFGVSSTPTFLFLRERKQPEPLPPGTTWLSLAFGPLIDTLKHLPRYRDLCIFFISFFFFIGGLSTVIGFSGIFADKELGMKESETIILFILLQLTAAAGAFIFGWVQDKIGSKKSISISLALWVVVIIACYLTHTKQTFYIVSAFAGIGMGSLQSCARAMVSQLCPPERAGEFFGFWGLFGKLPWVIITPIFGKISSDLGTRTALLTTAACFFIGWVILAFVREPRKISPDATL